MFFRSSLQPDFNFHAPSPALHSDHFEERKNVCKNAFERMRKEEIKWRRWKKSCGKSKRNRTEDCKMQKLLYMFCVQSHSFCHSFRSVRFQLKSFRGIAHRQQWRKINIKDENFTIYSSNLVDCERERASCGLFWQEKVENISLAILVGEEWRKKSK